MFLVGVSHFSVNTSLYILEVFNAEEWQFRKYDKEDSQREWVVNGRDWNKVNTALGLQNTDITDVRRIFIFYF